MRLALLPLLLAPAVAWASPRDVTRAHALLEERAYDEAVALLNKALREKQDFETLQQLRVLMDDALYGRAQTAGTAESYQAYLLARPQGAHVNDARLQLCEGAWMLVEGAADPAPLVAFAKAHPACAQASRATDRAAILAFASAKAQGTADAMRAFLAAWPGSAELGVAREIEDELSFQEALAVDGPEALEAYVAAHAKGPHAADARAEAEARSWRTALGAPDSASVVAFLARYPGSSHAVEAKGLMRQRGRGMFRAATDGWDPLAGTRWSPGTVVYKPPVGGAIPVALQVWGLHGTVSGSEASPVAFPLGRWAAGLLGLDPTLIERPSVSTKGPGADGEYLFAVPFALPEWTWNSTRATGYELRVVDAQGKTLDRARVEPGAGSTTLGPYYSGGSSGLKSAAAQHSADPLFRVAKAALFVQEGDYAGAAQAWTEARAVWSQLPADAPGLNPAMHSGGLYTAYASAQAAPGSAGDGFVPIHSAASGRFILSGPSSGSGTLLLDEGQAIGTARLTGVSARSWRYSPRAAWAGTVALNRGVSAVGIFDHNVYLVSPGDRLWRGRASFADFLERWPALRVLAGADPGRWLETILTGAGVSQHSEPYDLTGDGLPEFVGVSAGKLVVAEMQGDGTVNVIRSPLHIWTGSPALSPVVTDLDGDGRPELLISSAGSCNGLQLIVVRHAKGRTLVDEITFDDVCD